MMPPMMMPPPMMMRVPQSQAPHHSTNASDLVHIWRAQLQEAYSQISGSASPRDPADLAGSRADLVGSRPDLAVEPAEAARPFSAPIKR